MKRQIVDQVLRHIHPDEVVELDRQILRIPSFRGQERQLADFLANHLSDLGLEVEQPEVEPGRPNVIARLRGEGGGPSLARLRPFCPCERSAST